jgi:hypothetical protein
MQVGVSGYIPSAPPSTDRRRCSERRETEGEYRSRRLGTVTVDGIDRFRVTADAHIDS